MQRKGMRAEPFANEALRRQLLDRLNAIPGVSLPEDQITKEPRIPVSLLKDKKTREQFMGIVRWIVQQIRGGEG